MILRPATLALLLISLVVTGFSLTAAFHAMGIYERWDPTSGSEDQLDLEKKTSLISSIISYLFPLELLSLALFLFTAEELHPLFTGAMCAAGTLAVNAFGYPALLLKVVNALCAGVWLIINHLDTRAYDSPLIRLKYLFLTLMIPLLLLECFLLFSYFSGVKPDVITSCCGSLFSHDSPTLSGDLTSLPAGLMQAVFFTSMVLTTGSGIIFLRTGRHGRFFSVAAAVTFPVAIASIISFIGLYFYEMPSHHCPFCLLQKEYYYIGYGLYALLFIGAVTGISAGVINSFPPTHSLSNTVPETGSYLTRVAILCYLLFTLITVIEMTISPLRLSYF